MSAKEFEREDDEMDAVEEYSKKFETDLDDVLGECVKCGSATINGKCPECLYLEVLDYEESEDDPFESGLVTDAYEDAAVECKVFDEEDPHKMQEVIRKWLREKKKDKSGKDILISRSIQMVQSSGNRLYVFYLEDKSD
jgi:hypothetical protein